MRVKPRHSKNMQLPVQSLTVNVNEASFAELAQLPNIGEALAERIVEAREKNGRFHSIDELRNIRGLGPKTFEKLCPYLQPIEADDQRRFFVKSQEPRNPRSRDSVFDKIGEFFLLAIIAPIGILAWPQSIAELITPPPHQTRSKVLKEFLFGTTMAAVGVAMWAAVIAVLSSGPRGGPQNERELWREVEDSLIDQSFPN
jgi:competence ComEA-like helix-hairpin-helix protein